MKQNYELFLIINMPIINIGDNVKFETTLFNLGGGYFNHYADWGYNLGSDTKLRDLSHN